MFDYIKKPAPAPADLKANPILDYFKNGLVDLVLDYMDKHKEEIWKMLFDVLKGVLKKHPDVKPQVAALLAEHEEK